MKLCMWHDMINICVYILPFFKLNRRIKRYQTTKVKKKYKCSEPSRRQSYLHRYYSSSSSHTELALRVITLRVQAIQSLLYESCATSGKPSTWLPLGGLVEQVYLMTSHLKKNRKSATEHYTNVRAPPAI